MPTNLNSTYAITLPTDAPTTNSLLGYNGSNYVWASGSSIDDSTLLHKTGNLTETADGSKNFSDGLGVGRDMNGNPTYPTSGILLNVQRTYTGSTAGRFYNTFIRMVSMPAQDTTSGYIITGAEIRSVNEGAKLTYANSALLANSINNSYATGNTSIQIGLRATTSMATSSNITTYTKEAYGVMSYLYSFNTGLGFYAVDSSYGFYSKTPYINAPNSSGITVNNLYGFYAENYASSQINYVKGAEESNTYTSAKINQAWQFYANGIGSLSSLPASYIGNRLGVGFAVVPTDTLQIQTLLHVGDAGSGNDAVRVERGNINLVNGCLTMGNISGPPSANGSLYMEGNILKFKDGAGTVKTVTVL